MYGVETNDSDVRLNDQDKQNDNGSISNGSMRMVNKKSFLTEKEFENIDGLNDLTTKITKTSKSPNLLRIIIFGNPGKT